MNIITSIKSQKGSSNRYNLFVNDQFFMGISFQLLLNHQLKSGMELTENLSVQLQHEELMQEARNKALRSLSRRSYSANEIRYQLNSYPTEIVDDVIRYLKANRYLDDIEVARRFATERLRSKPRSLELIAHELQAKGISPYDIQTVIAELSGGTNEEDLAINTAKKGLKSYQNLDTETQKRRLSRYLARRGFSWEIINSIVDRLIHDSDQSLSPI